MRTTGFMARCTWMCILAVTLSSAPGCYGKCICTTTVVKWHGKLDWNKWAKALFFLPIGLIVLPWTVFIDFFIMNPIYFFSTDGEPFDAGLIPAPGGEMHCFVWTSEKFEEATWFQAIEPGALDLRQPPPGTTIVEVCREDDGSLLLTEVSTGATRRIAREQVAAPPAQIVEPALQ